MIRTRPTFAKGNFNDVFDLAPERDLWSKETVAESLAGKHKDINPPYRIPAADTKSDLFFDDLEMLSRFANMPLPDQEAFLIAIRETMKLHEVEEIHMEIKWSETETKTLFIKECNGTLDIYVNYRQ